MFLSLDLIGAEGLQNTLQEGQEGNDYFLAFVHQVPWWNFYVHNHESCLQ